MLSLLLVLALAALVSIVQGVFMKLTTLELRMLLLLLSLMCIELFLRLMCLLPGSYMNMQSLLMPKLLGLPGWLSQLWLLLPWSILPVVTLLLHAGLPLILLSMLLWLLQGTCTCLCFVVGSASPLPILAVLTSSCARWLYDLASLVLVASDGLGNAAANDKSGDGGSL